MSRRKSQDEGFLWLDVGSPPHLLGGDTYAQITRTRLALAALVGLGGVALFGLLAAVWLAIGVAAAVAAEWGYVRLTGGRITPTYTHAALMGMLVGLALPVGRFDSAGFHLLAWIVPLIAGIVAIVVGKGLMGGMGNYMWHPALVGRAAVELLYQEDMHPKQWVVLARDHLFATVPKPVDPAEYAGWHATTLPAEFNAWAMRRPVEQLRDLADGLPTGRENPLTVLMRDHLPPWEDTLLGGIGGGIGETCAILVIIAGLYLIYRGYVRWFQPLSVLLAAALAAAILPIRIAPDAGFDWMPGFHTDCGLHVGMIYVLYHLSSGELLLGAFFFATDMVASPRTARGQIIFGIGIGALTVALRLYGPVPGSCYWAILIMNTFIGEIDRRTKRRVMGT
ncbi:MAG: RnfABCDGE type electron transport complex subunit D [Phycisphaerae bacterium]|nr:RnfABCDGE type electron transport complex subunit D [Phycisphaerae bacterium]